MTDIRDARAADREPIVRLITEAFADLAANRYLVPDASRRPAVLRAYFGIHVDHALDPALDNASAAQVVVAGDTVVGAALWYRGDDPGPADYDARMVAAVSAERADRFRHFDNLLHEHTPEAPHDYLGFLAVAPGRQGRGIGGALLNAHHRRLDAAGRPAYLVASNADSARLYLRHGYQPLQPVDRYELMLPAGGAMYRMWRRAIR